MRDAIHNQSYSRLQVGTFKASRRHAETNWTNIRWFTSPTLNGTLTQILGANGIYLTVSAYTDIYITCKIDVNFSGGYTAHDIKASIKIFGPSSIVFDPMRNEVNDSAENKKSIFLYPNPNDGNFYLKLNDFDNEEGQLLLYDLIGKEYMSEVVILTAETPRLIRLPDNISEGIYILLFRNHLSNSYFKIIIDKP